MLSEIVLVLSILYALQMLAFAMAAQRAQYEHDDAFRPTVSIVIAARNEEKNISACLESIAKLTYPRELLEIIVVDDRSTDRTQPIVRAFSHRHPHIRLLVAKPGEGQLRGKTNAVTQGIESSAGEILLLTDADCAIPKRWVEETVKYYSDDSIGIVAGFTLLSPNGWFGAIQALDWFFLFSVAAATIKLHFPVTAVGTNFSVRRKAYEMTGGYRKIPFSVTEDYALFHAVTSTTPFRARIPMDRGALVGSEPCASLRILHGQKKRWFRGGRDMEAKYLVIMAVSFFLNLGLPLAAILEGTSILWVALGLKVLADFTFLLPVLISMDQLKLLRYFPLFEIYYFLYVLIYPPLVLVAGEVVWKERAYVGEN